MYQTWCDSVQSCDTYIFQRNRADECTNQSVSSPALLKDKKPKTISRACIPTHVVWATGATGALCLFSNLRNLVGKII